MILHELTKEEKLELARIKVSGEEVGYQVLAALIAVDMMKENAYDHSLTPEEFRECIIDTDTYTKEDPWMFPWLVNSWVRTLLIPGYNGEILSQKEKDDALTLASALTDSVGDIYFTSYTKKYKTMMKWYKEQDEVFVSQNGINIIYSAEYSYRIIMTFIEYMGCTRIPSKATKCIDVSKLQRENFVDDDSPNDFDWADMALLEEAYRNLIETLGEKYIKENPEKFEEEYQNLMETFNREYVNKKPEKVTYTFTKVENGEVLMGSSKLADLCIFAEHNDAQIEGRLKALFGEPMYETNDYEDLYMYQIKATDISGNSLEFFVYQGPTGCAIGGMEKNSRLEASLDNFHILLKKTNPVDFCHEAYYMDAGTKLRQGIKDGIPFFEEIEMTEEELEKIYEKYGY